MDGSEEECLLNVHVCHVISSGHLQTQCRGTSQLLFLSLKCGAIALTHIPSHIVSVSKTHLWYLMSTKLARLNSASPASSRVKYPALYRLR